MEHGTTESKKIKVEKQEQTHKETDEKEYPDVVAYKIVDSFEDGAAETPSGAILSLTLGEKCLEINIPRIKTNKHPL